MTTTGLATYPEIYMPCPFAGEADAGGTSGTNRSMPFSDSKSAANVNMRTGFPTVFTLGQLANGKYLSRPDVNQLGYMATLGQFRKQIGCLNEFNSSFAATIEGYAKGAVLDYVVWLDKPNNVIGEVWKIVSLKDKNTDAPSYVKSTDAKGVTTVTTNILDFGADKSAITSKSWLRVVPDNDYIQSVKTDCMTHTNTLVQAEATTRETEDAKKLASSDAKTWYACGAGKNNTYGLTDGTARDADGKPVSSQHTEATARNAGITITTSGSNKCIGPNWTDSKTGSGNSVLNRKTNLAVTGHVHTNIYTKDEVDAKLGSVGGQYANGSTQSSGYSNGTYSENTVGGVTARYGHLHEDICSNTDSLSPSVASAHDGTAYNSSKGGSTTNVASSAVRGHVHTNLATTESLGGLARGSTKNLGEVDCTYDSWSGTGHYHSDYVGSKYVDDKVASAIATHESTKQHGDGGCKVYSTTGVTSYNVAYGTGTASAASTTNKTAKGTVSFSKNVICAVAIVKGYDGGKYNIATYVNWSGNTVTVTLDGVDDNSNPNGKAFTVIAIISNV